MGSLNWSFDGSNDGKIKVLLYEDSMGYTDSKFHGSDEGIKLGCTDCKVLVTILGNVDGIILGLDVGTYLGYLDGYFDGSNDVNIEELLLGSSLGYTDGKVLGYYERTDRAGLTWSGVHVVVVGWMFSVVGCHATSKGAELSCDMYYTISLWS